MSSFRRVYKNVGNQDQQKFFGRTEADAYCFDLKEIYRHHEI